MMMNNQNKSRPLAKGPVEKAAPIFIDDVEINKYIASNLKAYQIDGIRFMYNAYKKKSGCILADEMGLGKTVQVIGFIAAILNKKGTSDDLNNTRLDCIKREMSIDLSKNSSSSNDSRKPTFLIVCPASIMSNWEKELNTWGYFSIGKFHDKKRNEALIKLKNGRLEIMVTTHETCRQYLDELNKFNWSAVIVDEFHRLKNDKSHISQIFREFITKTRIGLSGTILQNNLTELWALLDWVNPGCLGSKKFFQRKFVKPIKDGQSQNATPEQLGKKVKRMKELQKLKQKWILRRTKQIIENEFTKKSDQLVYCKLSEFQVELYKRVLKSEKLQYLLNPNEPCECNRYNLSKRDCCYSDLKPLEKSLRLCFLDIFLKLSNHPSLLLEKTKFVSGLIDECVGHEFIEQNKEAFNSIDNSGKLKVLESMLKVFRNENVKVLLFSYSVKLLNVLQSFAINNEYAFARLDGSTKTSERQEIVDRFNRDKNMFLFLISTRAGGVGLNITAANVVIIFDPNWNPTNDSQAMDRAHRLGQLKDVFVYRLISSGSIEENIYLRQVFKTHLSLECVENEAAKRLFKNDELFGIARLFKLNDEDEISKTRKLFERHVQFEKGEVADQMVSNFVESHLNKIGSIFEDSDSESDGAEYDNDSNDDESNDGEGDDENLDENENIVIDDDDEDDDEIKNKTLSDKLRSIFAKGNIVQVHSNKDLLKSGKIEQQLRNRAEKFVEKKSNLHSSNDDLPPMMMGTLDFIDLEQAVFDFGHDYTDREDRRRFFKPKNSNTNIQFGKVPHSIRKEQFKQMADMMKVSEKELASKVLAMKREERFVGLKAFYQTAYPETREFFETFSKLKQANDNNYDADQNDDDDDDADYDEKPHKQDYDDSHLILKVNNHLTAQSKLASKEEVEKDPYDILLDELLKKD